jgi:hypothetical protein
MAFCLAWYEGGRFESPDPAPRAAPPAEGTVLRSEDFSTREEAMVRARGLIGKPGISGLGLHAMSGAFLLDPHELAAELGVRLP